MLSGIILVVFLMCYCCHKNARKSETHMPEYWRDSGLPLHVYTVEGHQQVGNPIYILLYTPISRGIKLYFIDFMSFKRKTRGKKLMTKSYSSHVPSLFTFSKNYNCKWRQILEIKRMNARDNTGVGCYVFSRRVMLPAFRRVESWQSLRSVYPAHTSRCCLCPPMNASPASAHPYGRAIITTYAANFSHLSITPLEL